MLRVITKILSARPASSSVTGWWLHMVQRFKAPCPELGKRKIAQFLSRAGLHLAATTVHRFLQNEDQDTPGCQVREFLDRAIQQVGTAPKHLVCDQGPQFTDTAFKTWCKRRLGRKPRYGAVGKQGSIAVIERFVRTLKDTYLRKITIPYNRHHMGSEMTAFIQWYNAFRPHESLEGATPLELYESHTPANQTSRYEPRKCWPKRSPFAQATAPIKGRCGVKLELVLSFMDDHRKLPVVELRQAA